MSITWSAEPGGARLFDLGYRGYEVTVDGAVLRLGAADGIHDAVRDAVADLGIGLRRLGPRGRTLEDVYLGAGK